MTYSRVQLWLIPLLFCAHSSSLGLVIKWSLTMIPEPMLMTLLQVVFALCVCLVLRLFGAISFGARNSGRPMLRFAGAWCCIAMLFVGSLYSSNELVRRTDVEFVIAARSLTALVIAALEPLLLRSPWPNGAAVLCLVGIASFATAFAWVMQHGELADRAPPDVWTWTVLYIAFVSAESIAGKAMIDSESGLTPWGLTLCSNGFALCVLPVYIAMTGRLRPQSGESSMHYWRHWAHVLQPMLDGWRAPVGWFASCVLGTGISFFAMSTRRLLSAAQFTVLGVANKFATILFDHFVQVKSHTTVRGSLFLVCTIVTSLLYGIATNAARRQRESGVFSADRKRGRDDDPGAGEKGEGVAHYVARDARRGDASGDCAKDGANAIELRALLGTTTSSEASFAATPDGICDALEFATDIEVQAPRDGAWAAALEVSDASAERRVIEARLGAVTAELAALRSTMEK